MVISAIWSILPGQNRGPYMRNPVYFLLSAAHRDVLHRNKRAMAPYTCVDKGYGK